MTPPGNWATPHLLLSETTRKVSLLLRSCPLLPTLLAVPQPISSVPGAGHSRPERRKANARRPIVPMKSAWPDLRSQLSAIVEHSNDAIFSRMFDGTVTTWNAAAERIFGYTANEIIGRSSRVLLPAGSLDEYRRLVARLRRGLVVAHYEAERVCKDGRRIQVSLTLSPIRDSSRRLIGFSTIARDITEQRAVRDMLVRRERELDDLFEEASVGLVFATPGGGVIRANQAFLAMVELDGKHVLGRPLQSFHSDATVLGSLLSLLANRETVHNFATEFRTAKGETRFVLVDADALFENGHLVHSRWFIRDISRRRQLERELLESSDRERRGFAQELHDGLGQQLGGIAYLTNVLRELLSERGVPEAGSAGRIFDLVRKAIEDTRRMARGLSPIRGEPEGLMDALRELVAQTAELRGIRCRLDCRKPVLVPDVVLAGHLYRIAQEAVNNAVRHGSPRIITISLRNTRGRITLVIADDGKGIGPLSPNRKGLGLRTMQYRASLIRGALTVIPRHPRGTKISCVVLFSPGDSKPTKP
jgi:PAS domain S-box-containing protein